MSRTPGTDAAAVRIGRFGSHTLDGMTTHAGGAASEPPPDPAALTTEELRQRAFALARERRDIGFFWDLFTHVPHHHDESHDGWIGSLATTVEDAVALWGEATGHQYGEAEPVVRARFVEYLRDN